MNSIRSIGLWAVIMLSPVHGQVASQPASRPGSAERGAPTMPSIIQKLPDYGGDVLQREFLTGDWGGVRTDLAEHGILFELSATQVFQGNAHGGKDTNDAVAYSGSVDYTLKLDSARMGLWPGGLMVLRGETQFGHSINSKAGAIGAPNMDALLPVPDDSGITTLSEFYVMQALSEKFVLLAGKIDLTVGDANVFAHDERTQFLNAAFRVNPILFPSAPYTAMAAGAVWMPASWLTINTFVADNDPKGAATRTGFNTALHGRNWMSVMQEYDFAWKPFGLPGNQRFGWFWTSRDFLDFRADSRLLNPRLVLNRRLGPLRRLARLARNRPGKRPDDWGLYYNFDQYLYIEPGDETQGFGVFGRFGWSTGDSNPIEQFYSLGLGGKGVISGRDKDTCGIGYYHMNLSDDLPGVLSADAEQGVELYYNIAITPWLHITPDFQILMQPGGGFRNRDVALIYGIRAQMTF